MLSEQEVREAVQRFVDGREERPAPGLAEAARVEWRYLMTGEVVRCIETRTEIEQVRQGPFDLSDRLEYTGGISDYRIALPKDPGAARTVKLVRRGSVEERHCACGNGRVVCPRCQGRADLPCEAVIPCGKCRGIDTCLKCEGVRHAADPSSDQVSERRVACRKCGVADAVCPGCAGRGHVACTVCSGSGRQSCPGCGDGTVAHASCGGRGSTVTWIEGVIRRQPRVTEVKEPTGKVPYLVWDWARGLSRWARVEVAAGGTLPGRMSGEFRRLAEWHLASQEREVASRATFSYLTVARVTVPQHPHRVYYVAPGEAAPVVFPLVSARRAWQIVAIAFGVLAVVAALARLLP